MKKILCVFLAILTTVIFSGCFGESDSDSDKASELVYQDNMINDNADDDDADDDVKFYETCSTCNGSGKNACTWCNATGYQDIAGTVMLCGTCGGSGQMNCLICVGKGQLYVYDGPENNAMVNPSISGGYTGGYSGGLSSNCAKCNGEGIVLCISCNGTGGLPDTKYASDYNGTGMGMYQTTQKCLGCNGTGTHDCPFC